MSHVDDREEYDGPMPTRAGRRPAIVMLFLPGEPQVKAVEKVRSVLERCKEYLYCRELPYWQGIHSARIRGEFVLLRAMGENGMKLSQLAPQAEKTPLARIRVDVPDDSIWVLSVNAEEPTLKRVRYFVSGADWRMMIQADNPMEPGYPRVITRQDEVTFWARVIGIRRGASA